MTKVKRLKPFHSIWIFFIVLCLTLAGVTFHSNLLISLVFLFFGVIAIQGLFDDLK